MICWQARGTQQCRMVGWRRADRRGAPTFGAPLSPGWQLSLPASATKNVVAIRRLRRASGELGPVWRHRLGKVRSLRILQQCPA